VESWTRGNIDLQPWQAIPETMSALGLTDEDGLTQAWFVDKNGRLTGGAAAINQALRYCWWLRPFTYLYPLPGIRQLQDWVYRWIAKNRYRLPGSTPQCAIPNENDQSSL
jgi:predicted DCC family thiol-disulfide oxidoreductase YuxK